MADDRVELTARQIDGVKAALMRAMMQCTNEEMADEFAELYDLFAGAGLVEMKELEDPVDRAQPFDPGDKSRFHHPSNWSDGDGYE